MHTKFYPARLFGFGELPDGGVGLLNPRTLSASQMYLPRVEIKIIIINSHVTD